MEASRHLEPPDGDVVLSYADLARRLLAERAELFRAAPLRREQPLPTAPAPTVPHHRGGRHHIPAQLRLPLRPQLLQSRQ